MDKKLYKQAEKTALIHMSFGANVTQAMVKVREYFELDLMESVRLAKELSMLCPHKA